MVVSCAAHLLPLWLANLLLTTAAYISSGSELPKMGPSLAWMFWLAHLLRDSGVRFFTHEFASRNTGVRFFNFEIFKIGPALSFFGCSDLECALQHSRYSVLKCAQHHSNLLFFICLLNGCRTRLLSKIRNHKSLKKTLRFATYVTLGTRVASFECSNDAGRLSVESTCVLILLRLSHYLYFASELYKQIIGEFPSIISIIIFFNHFY